MKGGCKVGRKKEPKGGCKTGRKKTKEATHTMKDGTIHTGKTHTKDSRVVQVAPKGPPKKKVKMKPTMNPQTKLAKIVYP